MTQKNEIVVPPIIRDWVSIINNSTMNQNARDNYYLNLKEVSKYIEEELRKYDNAKLKTLSLKQVKRKK
jgi:hypothetical protein